MKESLRYLSENIVIGLAAEAEQNLNRYRDGNFLDLAESNGWGMTLKSIQVDVDKLQALERKSGAEAEIKNSLLLWDALEGMTPSLACEERIWVRLTHIECLEYSRERWLLKGDDKKAAQSVKVHFFANTQTKIRDDNAVSRLWWNAYIAKLSCPSDPEAALNLILKKADIRSNFIERSWIVSRPKVAGGIIRAMMGEEWITDKEQNYRGFMKTVNKYGGGILFETMSDTDVDGFMKECCTIAKAA